MLKILFFSDSHLGFDYPVRPKIKRRRRGFDFFKNFEKILNFAVEEGADLVIHGGDLFFRSKVPQLIIDKVYEILFDFADNGIPIFIVPGNHEKSRLPQSVLTTHPNISIFHKACTFKKQLATCNITVSGFPYIFKIRDRFSSLLKQFVPTGDINLLCFHQVVEGAELEKYTFRQGKNIIRKQDIPTDYDLILSGHIHRRQMMRFPQSENAILLYSGSIERTSFQEMNEQKGFYLIELEEKPRWHVSKILFKTIRTRPMQDLLLEKLEDLDLIKKELLRKVDAIDENSIIRIRSNEKFEKDILKELNTSFFRDILPSTMNFKIHKSLINSSD